MTNEGVGLLPRLGFWALLAALALAPLLGGTPVGSAYAFAAYGGDTMLGLLRALTMIACLLLLLFSPPAHGGSAPGPGRKAALAATLALSLARFWVLLSLLVHSAFLTNQTLLFAMVPEALNWFCFALVFGLGLRLTADRREAVLAAGAVTAGLLLVGVVGALEYGSAADRAMHRTVSTFFSPNFTAGFLALTLPVAVALCVGARSLLGMVGSGAAAALGFGVLISTGSRAGIALALLGLVLALVLAVARSIRGKGEGLGLPWGRVAALAALLLVLGVAFREPLLGRVTAPAASTASAPAASTASAPAATTSAAGTGPQEHSGEFRQETWKGSLAMARANPLFGAGPGTFPYTYPRYATVAWTGLAHSSYLQMASEAGFPALILAGAAGLIALLAGLRAAVSRPEPDEINPFLICGLVGGVAASLGRSFFDSEWSLLGNGLPFWALAGMAVAWRPFAPATAARDAAPARSSTASPALHSAGRRLGTAFGVLLPLIVTLLVLSGNTTRDAATVLQQTGKPEEAARMARAALGAWPPDPQFYFLAGQSERAVALEPSGRRHFQLARARERAGDTTGALESFRNAVEADPNSLQTRRAYAEAQESAGDAAGALTSWREMAALSEGPVGTIRAIPELTDTLPAFAYAALGKDAAARADWPAAEKRFGQAQAILESYADTPPAYQLSEIATSGGNTAARRQEVRALYEDVVIPGRQVALRKLGRDREAADLAARRIATVEKLDGFIAVPGG